MAKRSYLLHKIKIEIKYKAFSKFQKKLCEKVTCEKATGFSSKGVKKLHPKEKSLQDIYVSCNEVSLYRVYSPKTLKVFPKAHDKVSTSSQLRSAGYRSSLFIDTSIKKLKNFSVYPLENILCTSP